jgi:putative iron-regulated protein
MIAIHTGTYQRRDGSRLEGPGIAAIAAEKAPEEGKAVEWLMATAESKLKAIKVTADSGKWPTTRCGPRIMPRATS